MTDNLNTNSGHCSCFLVILCSTLRTNTDLPIPRYPVMRYDPEREVREQSPNLHIASHKLVLALKRIVVFEGKLWDKDFQIPLGGGILEEPVVADGVMFRGRFH